MGVHRSFDTYLLQADLQEHWCDRKCCSTRFEILVHLCSLRQDRQHHTKTERACHQKNKTFLSVPKRVLCSFVAQLGITSVFVDQVKRLTSWGRRRLYGALRQESYLLPDWCYPKNQATFVPRQKYVKHSKCPFLHGVKTMDWTVSDVVEHIRVYDHRFCAATACFLQTDAWNGADTER